VLPVVPDIVPGPLVVDPPLPIVSELSSDGHAVSDSPISIAPAVRVIVPPSDRNRAPQCKQCVSASLTCWLQEGQATSLGAMIFS
jgi:hypothetical protein